MKKILLAGLALSLSILAQAQTLELDPGFGGNGYSLGTIGGNHNQFYAIQKTSGESFICLGTEQKATDFYRAFLAKYTNTGILDNSFGTNGIVQFNDPASVHNSYYAMTLQSDGKILVGGSTRDMVTHERTSGIRRYNTDGTVDNTFGNNGFAAAYIPFMTPNISNISVQSDGKILLSHETIAGEAGITRMNANGSQDNTFGSYGVSHPGSGINGIFYSYVKALNDGKVLVAAYIRDNNGSGNINEILVYRLNSDGTTDLTFGVNGKFSYTLAGKALAIQNLNLQSDGKIIVGGYNRDPNSTTPDIKLMLIRLLTNGSPDNTFGTQGVANMAPEPGYIAATNVHVLNDDKLIVSYDNNDSFYSGLVKFTANGIPDVSFNNNSAIKIIRDIEQGNMVRGFEVQADQKIVFAGLAATNNQNKSLIGRLKSTGTGITISFKDMASIYPNPANDKLHINLTKKEATATVFDLLGKKVMEQKIYRNGTLALEQLNSGVYLLHLNSGTSSAAQQFNILR